MASEAAVTSTMIRQVVRVVADGLLKVGDVLLQGAERVALVRAHTRISLAASEVRNKWFLIFLLLLHVITVVVALQRGSVLDFQEQEGLEIYNYLGVFLSKNMSSVKTACNLL